MKRFEFRVPNDEVPAHITHRTIEEDHKEKVISG